jgi:glycosyltransferase involved in cell wall biosynthesis
VNALRTGLRLALLLAQFVAVVLPSHWFRRLRGASQAGDRVLILSFVEWEGAYQRPHHLADGLAQDRREDRQVVFAYWRRVHRIPADEGMAAALRAHVTTELGGRLTIVGVPAFPKDSAWPMVRWMNSVATRWHLQRHWRSPGGAMIVNAPEFAPLVDWLAPNRVIYDVMDELVSDAAGRSAERRLLESSDHVTTGTLALREDKGRIRPEATFVPCGVDFAHFQRGKEAPSESLRTRLGLSDRPVAGFFGALNHRLDGPLLAHLGEHAAEFDFVFIGPHYATAPPLPRGSNWKWPGMVAYDELPEHVALFDVALIPYHVEGMNRFLHPVKVMECMAAEKPVVTTALPEVVQFYGEFVTVAETPETFLTAMREAARDSPERAQRLEAGAAFARARRWEDFVASFRERLGGVADAP